MPKFFNTFASMQKAKKHIAIFLLAVFFIAMAPTSVWHQAFANHVDTADNYCDFYHKDLGTHIEDAHTSCDIFKTNTPVYNALTVNNDVTVFRVVISQHKEIRVPPYSHTSKINLPARAPPLA
jgi:hypothetical protein